MAIALCLRRLECERPRWRPRTRRPIDALATPSSPRRSQYARRRHDESDRAYCSSRQPRVGLSPRQLRSALSSPGMLLRYGPLDGERIDGRELRGGPVIIRSDKCPDHLVEYTPSRARAITTSFGYTRLRPARSTTRTEVGERHSPPAPQTLLRASAWLENKLHRGDHEVGVLAKFGAPPSSATRGASSPARSHRPPTLAAGDRRTLRPTSRPTGR